MRGVPTAPWGKLDKDETTGVVHAWHPLLAHCADVAACAEALLLGSLLGKRLAVLGGRSSLDEIDIGRLSFLAALHDIGKFNWGFQRKADREPRNTAGHVAEVLRLFGSEEREWERLRTVLPLEALAQWAPDDAAVRLLVAAVGHHGKPVAIGTRSGIASHDASLWCAVDGRDPFDGIAFLVASAQRWFPSAFEASRAPLPSTPAAQHAFSGLVMLADWLGSDREEGMFTFAEELDDRMPFARETAQRAMRRIGLAPASARASLGAVPPTFASVSEWLPRAAQKAVMDLPLSQIGSLTVLESETGSGKTEAALVRFMQLFHAGLVDGMTFALPTRTAATQLHGRIRAAMERAFADANVRPASVLAVPGYLQFDDVTGTRLPHFKVLWNDDAKARVRYLGWPAEQPKRYLAGTIVVATIDQVLLSSLRVGHAHLRATALLRHLLVVDEVHASDAYMNRILEEVLRFHIDAGGHAFLMSATLGSATRERFERVAMRLGSQLPVVDFDAARAAPYPVVHHATREGAIPSRPVAAPGLPKRITVETPVIADHPEAVARVALEAARRGARVLVLRNTVRDAVDTQHALETLAVPSDAQLLFSVREVMTLHHARFARSDRILLDEEIERRFGKSAASGHGVVAVATQTVQQSLDLDADVMFTDLAPMDVLLQRIGRVHRHRSRDAFRPEGFTAARIHVLLSDAALEASLRGDGEARGPHGVGKIYDNVVILEATRRELERRRQLDIPADNRALVEAAVHPEALRQLAAGLGGLWTKHLVHVAGSVMADRNVADVNVVDRAQHFGDYAFRDAGIAEKIASRLGESDRRVPFDEAPVAKGPFGERVRELLIPGWLAKTIPADPELRPEDVRCDDGGKDGERVVTFTFGGERFVYDRLGLRPSIIVQK